MMQVFVAGLELEVEIGALERERGRQQMLMVDIVAEVALPEEDDLSEACDYRALAQAARDTLVRGHVVLVETAAIRIADACLACSRAFRITVTIRKPAALSPAMAGVTLTRTRPSL